MRLIQKRKINSLIILSLALALFLLGSYFAFAYTTKSVWPYTNSPYIENSSEDSTDYSAPTEQEIESGQEAKKNTYKEGVETPEESGEKKIVPVGIAFADFDTDENAIDVRAFIPNTIEGDGTCTAVFTQDTLIVEGSSKSFVDFSSSQCEPILIPTSRFEKKGAWELIVSYDSRKSSGKSPTMEVEIK
jgi:hypothetical protein